MRFALLCATALLGLIGLAGCEARVVTTEPPPSKVDVNIQKPPAVDVDVNVKK